MSGEFTLDVTKIREQARKKMQEGAVTSTYGLDAGRVIEVLNEVVATEVVCWMRYTRHAISATGISRSQVAAEFTEHAAVELRHAMMAAERISSSAANRTSTRPPSPRAPTRTTPRPTRRTWSRCCRTTCSRSGS